MRLLIDLFLARLLILRRRLTRSNLCPNCRISSNASNSRTMRTNRKRRKFRSNSNRKKSNTKSSHGSCLSFLCAMTSAWRIALFLLFKHVSYFIIKRAAIDAPKSGRGTRSGTWRSAPIGHEKLVTRCRQPRAQAADSESERQIRDFGARARAPPHQKGNQTAQKRPQVTLNNSTYLTCGWHFNRPPT